MADSSQTDSLQPAETISPPSWLQHAQNVLFIALWRISWSKIGLFAVSLFLFILAITCMKEGAYALGPLVRDRFTVTNAANSMGFGWLFAYVIMSGSPVAAAALTFLDAGVVDQLSAYTMITGSRLGASLLVLIIGFIYVLRGRSRITSLDMGLLSLTVTGSIYLVGLFIGIGIMNSGFLNGIQVSSVVLLNSITSLLLDPILSIILATFPSWTLFLVGLGFIVICFGLFDRCLPEMSLKESQLGHMSRLIYRPWVMFLLGITITLISMSVSVSLAILVPLSQRHYVRRENVIPYIMGANISTYIDTLFAAVLLNNPQAFSVVLTSMVSVAIVSVLVLTIMYRHYEQLMLHFTTWIMQKRRNLVLFMVLIFLLPFLLLVL